VPTSALSARERVRSARPQRGRQRPNKYHEYECRASRVIEECARFAEMRVMSECRRATRR